MAPKAIKDGRRQSAMKKVHMAKFKGTHKDEAKVHKVNKTPSQAQAEILSLEDIVHSGGPGERARGGTAGGAGGGMPAG